MNKGSRLTHCRRGHEKTPENTWITKLGRYQCRICRELTRTAYRDKSRAWLKNFKKGLQCSRYGESHPACLHFHHLDPDKKEFKVSSIVSEGACLATVLAEIEKCIVLCGNCHAKEHWKD